MNEKAEKEFVYKLWHKRTGSYVSGSNRANNYFPTEVYPMRQVKRAPTAFECHKFEVVKIGVVTLPEKG